MEVLQAKSSKSSHLHSHFMWNNYMATLYCREAWEPELSYVPKKKRTQILVSVRGLCHIFQGQVLHSLIFNQEYK